MRGRFQHRRFGGDASIQSLEGKGHASHEGGKEMPPCLVTVQNERAESQPVGGLGWEEVGPTLGTQTGASLLVLQAFPGSPWRPPTCIAAPSVGGWLLLCVDYSLKRLLSPMPPHTTEIPFPSNEVSAGVLERRKAFN